MRNYIDQKTKTIGGAGHIVRALADSSDMGATWGPVRFAASLPDPICFSDLLRVNASTHGMTAKASGDDLLLLSNPSSTVGRKNLSIHASLDGGHEWQPLDPEATYGMVSNNFVRNGGDGYRMFVDAANAYDFGPDLADVTAEYLADNSPYEPYTDGRITFSE